MSLMLVDGTELLLRMHYDHPLFITSTKGTAIHGALFFIDAMYKLLEDTQATHAAVFFEAPESARYQSLCSYYGKEGRNTPKLQSHELPDTQMDHIRRALDIMGLWYEEGPTCGAMERIASYAGIWQEDVVIVSGLSRYYQLLRDNVIMLSYHYMEHFLTDADHFREQYGVPPEMYPTFAALVGDRLHGSIGIRDISRKSAGVLIRRHGDVEHILKDLERINSKRVKEKIRNKQELLQRNYSRVLLKGDTPLPAEPDALSCQYPEVNNMAILDVIGIF